VLCHDVFATEAKERRRAQESCAPGIFKDRNRGHSYPLSTLYRLRIARDYSQLVESLVVLVAADEAVNETARHVADLVRGFATPVVFVTREPPEVMLPLVREAGVRHPFIAGGGAWLYVPDGYFPAVLGAGSGDEPDWQALRLQPRRSDGADAVRLLMAMYRFGDDPILFVGLGETWKHRNLLRAVDVPLIVRNDSIDQTRLLRTLPCAHLTTAAGPAGYAEAIFGSVSDLCCVPEC
jgi:hypothetical protein